MLQASVCDESEQGIAEQPQKIRNTFSHSENPMQPLVLKKKPIDYPPSSKLIPGNTVRPTTEQKLDRMKNVTQSEFFQPKKRLP